MDVMFFPLACLRFVCFYSSLSHGDTHDIHYTQLLLLNHKDPVFCGSRTDTHGKLSS